MGLPLELDCGDCRLRGLEDELGGVGVECDVEKIARRSFSSWILLFPRTPTRGWELLVMEQLLTGWRYVRTGSLVRER